MITWTLNSWIKILGYKLLIKDKKVTIKGPKLTCRIRLPKIDTVAQNDQLVEENSNSVKYDQLGQILPY